MCDHCVRRQRAYDALPAEEQATVNALQEQEQREMAEYFLRGIASGLPPTEEDQRNIEDLMLRNGEALDLLLGIATPQIPDSPPDWLG